MDCNCMHQNLYVWFLIWKYFNRKQSNAQSSFDEIMFHRLVGNKEVWEGFSALTTFFINEVSAQTYV